MLTSEKATTYAGGMLIPSFLRDGPEAYMRKALLFMAVALLISCVTGTRQIAEIFQKARVRGDVPEMRRQFVLLIKSNVVRLGMTEQEVVAVLGRPDSGTGIYVPGGHSIGYGKGEPGIDYDTFFWIHFRNENWDKIDEKPLPFVLIGWDYPVEDN